MSAATGPCAIVSSAHHWSAPVHLSAHHLADGLVRRGWRVAFLTAPTSPLHRLGQARDPVARARFADWRRGGGWDREGRLFHYTPLALLPPSRLPPLDRPWVFRNWPRFTVPGLIGVLGRAGFARPDLMLIDLASLAPLWEGLGRPRLVYRVTDRNREFPGTPPMLHRQEEELARAAELVVHTGAALGPYVASLGPRESLCIANGVEHAHFARTRPEPAEYREIPRPRALYVGSIAAWLDVDLLRKAALALPDLALVIIGPGSERLAALTGLANVHLLGARPYADIPAYMQHAEVGLIPFKRAGMEGFVDDINPLKLYEYMAAGLPVLATRFRQLELLGGPTHLVDGEPAFIAVLGRLAAAPGDGAAERAFAARFDWARQLEPLFDRLRL